MIIRHVINVFGTSYPDNVKRAMAATRPEYTKIDSENRFEALWIRSEDLERDATTIGLNRKVPFIKDLIDLGFAEDNEVLTPNPDAICLTNWDCGLPIGTAQLLFDSNGLGFSFRRDFLRPIRRPITLEYCNTAGQESRGVDLVCVTKDWWDINRDKFPDMFLGFEGWDWVFRFMLDRRLARKDAYLDCVYHEFHGTPHWKINKLTSPCNLYNRRLAYGWWNSLTDPDFKKRILKLWPELKTIPDDPGFKLPESANKLTDSKLTDS